MSKTAKITFIALFAALATILMYFEFPIPFMPPFLKVDLSGAVVLIGAFIFGIKPAIAMILVKDLIHLMQTQTGGSGELADFLMLSTLVIVSVSIYARSKTRKTAFWACMAGTVSMAIMSMLANYFILIPFYSVFMSLDAIFAMCSEVNPFISGMSGYLLLGVFPFNLLKGIILTTITMLAYKKLSVFIKDHQANLRKNQESA